MSLPYFPMYPADFEADTSHLTLEEDGAYNRLLRLMWMTPGCSLPDDDKWICRRMRCDADTFERVVKPLIDEFFKREKGRVLSPRLRAEFEESNKKHKKRVEAGKRGGRPRKPLKTIETDKTNAKAMQKQCESNQNQNQKEKIQKEKTGRATRIPGDFPGANETEWARSKGLSEHQVKREIEKFTEYWGNKTGKGSTKLDWSKTWKVWVNNAIDKGWVVVANANGGISETERAIQQDIERKKKRQQEGSAQPEHLFLAAGGMR